LIKNFTKLLVRGTQSISPKGEANFKN